MVEPTDGTEVESGELRWPPDEPGSPDGQMGRPTAEAGAAGEGGRRARLGRDRVSFQGLVILAVFFQGRSSWLLERTKTPRAQRCRTTEEPESCRVSTVTVSVNTRGKSIDRKTVGR